MTTLTITGISHDLRGVARQDGLVWFVDGALPGEVVTVRETGRRQQAVEAEILSVEKQSVIRTDPACEYYGQCGGCSLQQVTHAGQLELKQQAVLDQLKRLAHAEPQCVLPPIVSRPWQYRRRARLSTKWLSDKKQLVLGFRQRKGHAILEIEHCAVLEPELQRMLLPLRRCLRAFSNPGKLGHVDMVHHNAHLAIGLRMLDPPAEQDITLLQDLVRDHNVHVYLQVGTDEVVTYPLSGAESPDNASPGDFLQGNAGVNELLIEAVIKALEPEKDDRLLEAFCGCGNFTFPLAAKVHCISAVEVDPGMVGRASAAAAAAGISNCVFHTGNLDDVATIAGWQYCYNKLLLDPPRSGARQLCEHVPLTDVTKIVYVSCNPSTLARDAGILVGRGWQLASLQLVDMFPQTIHIESIAVFVPQDKKQAKVRAGKPAAKGSRIRPFSIR